MGAADPAIDAVIEEIVEAEDRDGFVAAVRALDRLLIAGRYIVPLYHAPGRVAGPLEPHRAALRDVALRLRSHRRLAHGRVSARITAPAARPR
jgi:hypothetical protein